jgi:transcriptional regulator with XRE-family HTH domain
MDAKDIVTQISDEASEEQEQQRLAERLREAREYLGLSQQFVAEHAKIPRVAISAIENGKRRVEATELARLARLYKYPVDYFLDAVASEPPVVRALAREATDLTESDRDQVLKFAQFLKGYGKAQRDAAVDSTDATE